MLCAQTVTFRTWRAELSHEQEKEKPEEVPLIYSKESRKMGCRFSLFCRRPKVAPVNTEERKVQPGLRA